MTASGKLEAEITRLQAKKYVAERREAEQRFRAIFGNVKIPEHYSEEALAMVARVYVLRAHKRDDLRDKHLPDHEWIRLWHEANPQLLADDLWDAALGYISGGCGVAG